MTEPKPIYNEPQSIIRSKLARRRVLINELVTIEAELWQCGAIKRTAVNSRRMVHEQSRMVSIRPRRVDIE